MSEIYKIQVNDSEPIEVSQQVYEVSFCFNEMLKEKDKEIERLKEENNFLKLNNPQMNLEHFRVVKENKRKIDNLRLVNKRLNNIINELEKWLDEDLKQVYRDAGHRHNLILEVLDKLQELKGSDK